MEQVVRCPAAPIKCKDSLVADANDNIPHGNIVYVAFNDPDILKGRGEKREKYCRMNNFKEGLYLHFINYQTIVVTKISGKIL
jgi:hypothetical protein